MKKTVLAAGLGVVALMGGVAIAQPGASDKAQSWTRAEAVAKATERFTRMDVNKDGQLDASDRAERMKTRADARFARLDTDKNGQISRAEFDAGHAKRGEHRKGGKFGHRRGGGGWDGAASLSQADFQARALARFDRLDANKDGTVTPAERQAARAARRAARTAS